MCGGPNCHGLNIKTWYMDVHLRTYCDSIIGAEPSLEAKDGHILSSETGIQQLQNCVAIR